MANLASGAITGVEALLRWQRPGEGLVPPDKFVRALEASRLIVPVGAWVIACEIATAVAALAHSMTLLVVCEGVENMDPLAFIRTLGCDAIQGYLLARPMPADVLTDWIQRYNAGDEGLTAWRKLPTSAADSTRARHRHPVPSLAARRADVARSAHGHAAGFAVCGSPRSSIGFKPEAAVDL